MENNYTQEQINEILLTKKLSDFYLATIENRPVMLTDEEFEKIMNSDSQYIADSKENIDEVFEMLKDDKRGLNFAKKMLKAIISIAQIRHMACLTLIDGIPYDVFNCEFINPKRVKVIDYINILEYLDEASVAIKLFTPKEEPSLKYPIVNLDFADLSPIMLYESNHINQKLSKDLTKEFLVKAKESNLTLKKKK